MGQTLRSHGTVIFACLGFATMVAMRSFDGQLRNGNSTAYAELSGWLLLIIGFTLARRVDSRFEILLQRLAHRGAITVDQNGLDVLIKSARRRAITGEWIGLVVFPTGLTLAYYRVYSELEVAADMALWVKLGLEVIAATITGRYAGRLVSHGLLGRLLRRHQAEIRVTPTHPDGAGGLRVVGDYYLYQAGLILLPVIFFAFWFVAGPVWNEPEGAIAIQRWKFEFGVLFFVMLGIEIAAFIVPLLYFHTEMREATNKYLREADELGNEVVKLKAAALTETDPNKITSVKSRYSLLEEEITTLENVPTWPINAGIRKRFAWWNVLVFTVPVIAKQDTVSSALKTTFAPFLER